MFSFCLGFRNWHLRHLANCLASIRAMTVESRITIVDLGSDPDVRDAAREMTRHVYPASFGYEEHPEWSRAAALNRAAAIAACRSPLPEWFVFTDADMLFPSEWITIAEAQVTKQPMSLWLTRSRDLTRDAMIPDARDLHYADTLLEQSLPHSNDLGQGAAMVVPRWWFERVGGFDEVYKVWGAEDNDLSLRAEWDGLTVTWLPEAAWVAHQWHRRDWATDAQIQQVRENRAYLAQRILDRGPIKRNER